MNLRVDTFDGARDTADWEALCRAAPMSTLLHTRAFLSYHGDRFEDQSRTLRNESGQLIAVFPAARMPKQADTVCSHPGATYGGLIHAGDLLGESMLAALALLCRDYQRAGFTQLRYKLTPHIYHCWPACDDLYALWRLGAAPIRCDLSSAIDLTARREPSSRRRRAFRKAQSAGFRIEEGAAQLEAFWQVLVGNLSERHDARPVHSLQEMQLLMQRFPDEIHLVTASLDGKVEAGTVLFESQRVSHAQYIACSDKGREHHALDALFEHCIARATARERRYFDFGISNEDEGRHLNTGLYQFKSEFGGGGVTHLFHELKLDHDCAAKCAAILQAQHPAREAR